jgi:hypothetical protein
MIKAIEYQDRREMRRQRFLPVESWMTTSFWQQEAEAAEVIMGGGAEVIMGSEADEAAELWIEFGAKPALLCADVEGEVMKE